MTTRMRTGSDRRGSRVQCHSQSQCFARSAARRGPKESEDDLCRSGTLGDKPLIVLTAGRLRINETQMPKGVTRKDFEDLFDIWVNDLQMRETHLSTRGRRIMVPDSGHIIPFERPDSIVSAIREVCVEVNTH